jgi:ribosomal protein S18 acetylase RimI-like enzyme
MTREEQVIIRSPSPEDASDIARVHVDAWRETYNGILPTEVLEGLSYERREQHWHEVLSDPSSNTILYVLDRVGEGIKGFVAVGPERDQVKGYDGELYAIYLLKEVQGQGHGRRLFERGIEALRQKGFQSMVLWVLKDNPSRGFYEHLGGVVVGEKPIEIGEREYVELAFGWPQL